MFGLRLSRKEKEDRRYYLLPGMGKANRRKHRLFVKVAVLVGLICSGLMAALVYFTNR